MFLTTLLLSLGSVVVLGAVTHCLQPCRTTEHDVI